MKKFLALITLFIFSALVGGAASFVAENVYQVNLDPAPFVAGAFVVGLTLDYFKMIPTNVLSITMQSFSAPTSDNIGGTTGTAYMAEVSTFTTAGLTAPVAYDAATTFTEMAENASIFVFSTGGRFWEVYITANTGKLMYKEQGDEDGRSYKPEAEIFYPGDDIAAMGMMRWMKNQKWVVLLKAPNGRVHQIGTREAPARLVGEWESATNSSGVKGMKIKVSTSYASGPIIYTASIPLTAAV